MFNYHIWFPEGKILFMAPTKPLVRQQYVSLVQQFGFPIDQVVELTGTF